MKTILVPIDGSSAASKALDVALDLAEKHGATVKLLHALLHEMEPDALLGLPDVAADEKLTATLHGIADGPSAERSVEQILQNPNAPERPTPDDVLNRIGTCVLAGAIGKAHERGITAQALDMTGDAPANAICAAADQHAPDAIVMGMRGLSQIEAFTFGSVSQDVCRTVKCTCIAVH
jgi:nucleotide-binding universal stress UspA family protein